MVVVTNPGTEYTNTMAIAAMGAKAAGNPLHHDQAAAGSIPARLTVDIFQLFPASGTFDTNVEKINNDSVGDYAEAKAINQYAEIVFPALVDITQYRHYGQALMNADGVWKIQYLNTSFVWVDWVTGIATRVATWSNWDSSGGGVQALGIRWVCTTLDSLAESYISQLEVKY